MCAENRGICVTEVWDLGKFKENLREIRAPPEKYAKRVHEFRRPNHHYSPRNNHGSGGFLCLCVADLRKSPQNTSISALKRCPTGIPGVSITKSAESVERGGKSRAPEKSTPFFRHLCRETPYKIPPAPEIETEHLFKAKMDGFGKKNRGAARETQKSRTAL